MENVNVNSTLLKFARELKEITEDFEEELEILTNKEVMENISKSENELKSGKYKRFKNINELKKEVD